MSYRQGAPEQPVFFFTLASPACWLVAERILAELPALAEWVPADLGAEAEPDWVTVAAAAPMSFRRPVEWPPSETERALLAATYAKGLGKGVAFALAAFRQVFAGGRALDDPATLHLAGAACEMHPLALDKGLALRSTGARLEAASAGARAAGVTALPAVVTAAGEVHAGHDCLAGASAALAS